MKRRNEAKGAVLGLVLALGAAKAEAQVILSGTFTGGSSFATTMSGTLQHLGGGILQLDITNVGSGFGEVFAAIGIVNVPAGTVTPGTAPTGWTWMTTNQLSGNQFPDNEWAWIAPQPRPQRGLQQGESATFTFGVGSLDYTRIGFGVHAISGPNDCSTKFGVWRDASGAVVQTPPGTDAQSVACRVTVPEPESLALLLAGIFGLGFVAVRRRDELA